VGKPIMPLGWTWQIKWGNPYTEPPYGQPRVRYSVTRPVKSAHPVPAIIDRALRIIGLGQGWCLSCGPQMPEPKRLSPEAKGKMRRRNLERRMEKTAPMFASDLIQIELQTNPEYYAGSQVRRQERLSINE
jgi:hypothetical protein